MSSRGSDPQEWAMKRKAAVERAKQLREERKSGSNSVDENATFQPVVNRRPSYLDSRPDTLDAQLVAGNAKQLVNSNDIFERALPGNKNYDMNNSKIPISPSGDALGKEMKKFNYSNSPAVASKQQPLPIQPTAGYRSKFMQQYESDSSISQSKNGSNDDYAQQYTPSNNINDKNSKAEKEAEEIFMSTLRSSNVNSYSNTNYKKSAGPGWNDDTSTSGLYESNTNRTPNKIKSGTNINSLRPSPTQSHAHPDPPINRHKQQNYDNSSSNWNNGASINPSLKKTSPAKASNEPIISPRIRPSEDVVVTQARSRLSLLKSKIRKSESSGSSRSDSTYMRSNSAEYDDGVGDNFNDYNIHSSLPNALPKSAPAKKHISAPTKDRIPVDQSQQRRPSKPSNDANDANTYSSMYSNNSGNNRAGKSSQNNDYLMDERQQVNGHKVNNNSYDDTDDYEYGGGMDFNQNINAPIDVGEQHECPDCGRKFNSGPFEKHIKICKKVFQQKRKVFDSTKMRVQDNPELVKILKTKSKSSGGSSAAAPKAKKQIVAPEQVIATVGSKPDWKKQSDQFREAMKAARQVTKAIATGAPLPPPVISAPDPSLIPCPHCGRRFSEKAGLRHIPQCQNIIAKPSRLNRGSGGGGGVNGTLTAAKKVSKGIKF